MPAHHRVGRYLVCDELAAGGMATVHFGCMLGSGDVAKPVAIKRLHPHLAKEPELVAMLLDEARIATRVHHPNVVSTIDVVSTDREVFIVMEYVHGESLARLLAACALQGEPPAPDLATAVIVGVLRGLHAAHETTGTHGEPLHVIHRDVSPQNVLVGCDGVSKVLDFGIAKAAGRMRTTRDGKVRGKLGYMAPEQVAGEASRRTDVFAAAVVLWEMLTARRLSPHERSSGEPPRPSELASGISPALEAIVMRGLAIDPKARFGTAEEMADALEQACPPAPSSVVAEWVSSLAAPVLESRLAILTEIEASADARGEASDAPDVEERTRTMTGVAPARTIDAPRRRARAWLAAAVVLLAAVLSIMLLVSRRGESAPGREPSLPPAEEEGAAVAAQSEPEGPEARDDEAPPAVHAGTSRAQALPPRRPSKRTAPRPCDVPFRFDAGRKIPKPECF